MSNTEFSKILARLLVDAKSPLRLTSAFLDVYDTARVTERLRAEDCVLACKLDTLEKACTELRAHIVERLELEGRDQETSFVFKHL